VDSCLRLRTCSGILAIASSLYFGKWASLLEEQKRKEVFPPIRHPQWSFHSLVFPSDWSLSHPTSSWTCSLGPFSKSPNLKDSKVNSCSVSFCTNWLADAWWFARNRLLFPLLKVGGTALEEWSSQFTLMARTLTPFLSSAHNFQLIFTFFEVACNFQFPPLLHLHLRSYQRMTDSVLLSYLSSRCINWQCPLSRSHVHLGSQSLSGRRLAHEVSSRTIL